MKKVNPEDLKEGQECYVKVRFATIDKNQPFPLILIDCDKDRRVFSLDQPIYTLDNQPQHSDSELEMLVNVANDIFCASNNPKYTVEDAAVDAYNLIAACKKIKEGER